MVKSSLQLQGYTYLGVFNSPNSQRTADFFVSADGKTEVQCYQMSENHIMLYYESTKAEDLERVTGVQP